MLRRWPWSVGSGWSSGAPAAGTKISKVAPWSKPVASCEPRWFGWKTAAMAVVAAWIVQDVVLMMLDHRQYAQSVICADPAVTATGGKWAHRHCAEHAQLGSPWLIRAWLAAFYEAHAALLAATGAALVLI